MPRGRGVLRLAVMATHTDEQLRLAGELVAEAVRASAPGATGSPPSSQRAVPGHQSVVAVRGRSSANRAIAAATSASRWQAGRAGGGERQHHVGGGVGPGSPVAS